MIGTLIRHWVFDTGISVMFDGLISNFNISKQPTYYLGDWWTVGEKDDGHIICWGRCIQEEGNLIVLDDGDSEFIIHTDLYNVNMVTEQTCEILGDKSLDGQSMIQYLNALDDGYTYS